ncbi:MAG: putative ligase-like protein, partial [Acidimicrobiales bacterium]|nr:putative ligase-like protein [Acidimicrobiales bacterium]
MLFAEVVATSADVTATPARAAKTALLAGLLQRLAADEVEAAVGFLTGEPRQGRIGVGWATLSGVAAERAALPSLTVAEVDAAISELAITTGAGSGAGRSRLLDALFGRATVDEADFLVRLFGGELRQGANEGVMVEAVAKAAGVPVAAVRRAHMLGGRLDTCARAALFGGAAALEEVRLVVGRPVRPMLASTAADTATALAELGPSSVEWKLDGIRIQAHRDGDDVTIFTRNLNDITARVPELVAVVRALPVTSAVLDGEAVAFDDAGRPRMFQDTVSWRTRAEADATAPPADDVDADDADDADAADQAPAGLRPYFFDCLHVDGRDLIDHPLDERLAALAAAAGPWQMPGTVTDDPDRAAAVLAESLAAGHEGVVAKGLGSIYEAGRRGKAWRKVKPVHTLDLVVLAAEWGHGRRQGWLSNLHLGARDSDGGFVMVGKTFKGLTDELLRWQTDRLSAIEDRATPGTVWVRPELVVEVAVDGVQASTR